MECPVCGRPLIIGTDGKQYIEYPAEKLQEFAAGLLSITQLNEFAQIYYDRSMLCSNKGNNNTFEGAPMNPPCKNYYGLYDGTIDKPNTVVRVIKIRDN